MGKVKTLSPTTAHKIGSMINGCKANIQPAKLAPAVERVNRVQYFEEKNKMNIFKALNRGRGKAALPGKTGYCYRSAEDFHFYWSGAKNRKSSTHDLERDDWDAFQQYPAEEQMVLDVAPLIGVLL